MFRFACLCLTALALHVSSPALADDIYDCRLRDEAINTGWLSTEVIVSFDAETGKAIVNDAFINYLVGTPIEGKVEANNTKRLTVSWVLTDKTIRGKQVKTKYRLTITKADLKASFFGQALENAQTFQSRGACRKAKG